MKNTPNFVGSALAPYVCVLQMCIANQGWKPKKNMIQEIYIQITFYCAWILMAGIAKAKQKNGRCKRERI